MTTSGPGCSRRPRSRPSAGRTAPPGCCPAGPTTTRRSTRSSGERFFGRDWQVVGRAEDVPTPGSYVLATIDDEPLIVVRGRDGVVRAFYNVCRHRGTAVAEEPCGTVVRLQCPYHAWIYDLEGNLVRAKHTDDLAEFDFGSYGLRPVRLATWGGFLFATPRRGGAAARGAAGRPRRLTSPASTSASLRSARIGDLRGRRELEVHRRELQRVLPLPGHPSPAEPAHAVRPGRRLQPRGRVAGRLDGARRRRRDDGARRRPSRRPPADARATAPRRAPDHLLPRLAEPVPVDPPGLPARPQARRRPARTTPGSTAGGSSSPRRSPVPDFDPTDAVDFWDLTNRQDWHVCELQQRGTRSRSWVSGRYSTIEPSRPRLRPHGRGPLRRRRRLVGADRPPPLRRAAGRRIHRGGSGERRSPRPASRRADARSVASRS